MCRQEAGLTLSLPPTLHYPSSSGACELTLDAPECGFDTPASVEPLTFTIKDDVPVRVGFGGCGKRVNGEKKTRSKENTHTKKRLQHGDRVESAPRPGPGRPPPAARRGGAPPRPVARRAGRWRVRGAGSRQARQRGRHSGEWAAGEGASVLCGGVGRRERRGGGAAGGGHTLPAKTRNFAARAETSPYPFDPQPLPPQTVQNLIERCLQLYMSQREAVFTLQARARVDPSFTALVWAKLEAQNAPFFRAYYTRLKLKDQIVLFNHLLEQQVAVAAARVGGGGEWPGGGDGGALGNGDGGDRGDGLAAPPPPPPAGFGGGGLPRPPSTASLGELDLAVELAAAAAARGGGGGGGGAGSGAATPQGLPRNFSLSDLAFDVGGDGDSVT